MAATLSSFVNWKPFSSSTPSSLKYEGRKPKKNSVTLFLEIPESSLAGSGVIAAINQAFVDFQNAATSKTGNRDPFSITLGGKTIKLVKGFEKLQVQIGSQVFTSQQAFNTFVSPSISAAALPSGVSEGQSLLFQISNIGLTPGTVLSYTIGGTISASDVEGGAAALSGTRVVKADGTVDPVSVRVVNDLLPEALETALFTVSATSPTGTAISASTSATIQDTTPTPAINVNAQPTSVDEGAQLSYLISTVSLAPGTVLSYAITGLDAADVLGGAAVFTGTRTVNADGSVDPVVITIANDFLDEPNQTATITVNGVNAAGLPVSGSAAALVVDTNLPPAITVSAQPTAVSEGGVLSFAIATTSVAPGTLLTYTIDGTIQPNEVLGGLAALNGTRTVKADGSVDPVVITILEDLIFGEQDTVNITVSNGAGTIGFAEAEVQDTTLRPTIIVSAQPTSVDEGAQLSYLISTVSLAPGTVLSYAITGLDAADVLGGSAVFTGTRTVNADGSVDPVVFTIANDFLDEPDQTATITVSGLDAAGLPVSGSAEARVIDTNLPPSITASVQPLAVSEGGVLTYTITTTSVAPGTELTWTIDGIQAADVLGGVRTGTSIVNADGTVAPVQITIATDLEINEQETAVFTVSGAGLTSNLVQTEILDTSSNVLNLTVNQDIFVETDVESDLIFSAAVVPGGAFGVGFNTLQNVDSLVGGSGQDQLIGSLTSLGGVVVQPLVIDSIETVSISSLNAANTLSLLNSDSVTTLENISSSSALTFSNIPGQPLAPGGLPDLNINGVFLPGASTTLQFQPVALVGNQTLNIITTSSGVNVNGGTGAPLQIITGPGIEAAVIIDRIPVPDFQVDYDLSQLDIPAISISSFNSVRLSTTGGALGQNGVNLNTTSIDGSGISGVFTVDLSSQAGSVSIQGGGGNDQIKGRLGSSTLVGNAGNDSLTTFAGNDSLGGGIGNDTLVGGEGNNSFEGDAGNDSITAGAGNDVANGGDGNDTISLGDGNNQATGGAGLDSILTGLGNDVVSGGSDADTINSGDGSDTVTGDDGSDSILFGAGLDNVSGGAGDDYFAGDLTPGIFNSTDTINGDGGVNTLEITAANADLVANNISGTPFVDNIQVLNISGVVGASPAANEVNAALIDSTIATVNLFNGTGGTASVFTFNAGSSTLNISTQAAASLNAAATFNVVGAGTADSLTINGPAEINYLNGQNLTFNGFDANTVTINTVNANQAIGTLTATPTAGEDSRFVFQGSGGFTINSVSATAGDLTLDFTGLTGVFGVNPFAIVNATDVAVGNTVSILGSAGSDTFVGDTVQVNTIQSFDGNDSITVGSGNDSVLAGTGNDTITPGTGNDTVLGEAGDDRFNVGDNLTLLDRFNGGDGIDTIQLTGKLGDPINVPFTQGWTASDLEGVNNFETLELDVIEDPSLLPPDLITVQDLFNFTVNGNTIQTVNLTDADDGGDGSALLFNAPTSLVDLGILETLDNVTVRRRTDGSSDELTVTLFGGSDLLQLDLRDEETINFVISGDTVIDTLIANDLTTLNVSGRGSFVITNPIVGATQLATLNLGGFSVNSIVLDASVSTVDMTVTGPTGLPLIPISYTLNLFTGSGNDSITATGFGANTIDANGGNDTIQTAGFSDLLTGDTGNDSISAGGGNDTVFADQGNDTVDAGSGNDDVFGDLGNTAGNDSLFGGLGNDTLSGGLGADTIDGGADIDTYASGFTVVLAPPGVQDPANTGQILGQVVNISNVGVDDLYITGVTGLSVAASIEDVAAGTANYLYSLPLPLFGGSPVTDLLSNIENVNGTENGNDFLIGSGDITTAVVDRDSVSTRNRLDGLTGNDTYQGGYGSDTFITAAGADVILDLGLVSSGGNEVIEVAAGASLIGNLADDWDTTAVIPSVGTPASINGGAVVINLNGFNANLSNTIGAGTWTINGSAGDESVVGSANDDLINGGGGNDTLDGAAGNDTVNGDAGDDAIFGGLGDDQLNGGSGNDTIDGEAGADLIDGGVDNDFLIGGLDGDSIFGGSGLDVIEGQSGADSIDAGADDDTVEGGSEADAIFGNDGNDLIFGYDGLDLAEPGDTDSIFGGAGNDTISGNDSGDSIFGESGADVISGGTGSDSVDGGLDNDTLAGDEGDDTLNGASGADLINGGLGNDQLNGGDDNDTVTGFAGNDQINGGLGDDQLNGDEGSDIIDGGDGADSILGGTGIDSILGGLGSDTILGEADSDTVDSGDGLDSVIGGEGNDSIIGAGGSDTLVGGLGNDTFTGNDGDDSIVSDPGNDSAFGGAGNDTITLGAEADTIAGDGGNDSLLGGEGGDLIDGGADNDSIFGGTGDDAIAGNTGNDSIDAESGNDSITGAAGTDTLFGQAGNDDISAGSENDIVTGGLGNDTLFGDAGSDDIVGGDGNDVIDGGTETDLLKGGEGDDIIFGQADFDLIAGEAGNDSIDGGTGDDIISGEAGTDTILGQAGSDTIAGGDGDDEIDGGDDDDTIQGDAGNDSILGGLGNDDILGNAGSDTIAGGDGDDEIDGGDDDDTIQGDAGNDSILGGLGNDDILGNAGSDTIAGGDGDDEIDGGDDDDTIQGDAGNDSILGGLGNDDILGNAGSDTIAGGDGDDEIDGGDDDDTIQGDAGNDSILGGLGNDDILGNAGSDTIAGGDGDDEIDGGDDDDTIQGDAGNDSILGGLGNDDILGIAGSDTIAGGDGDDEIDGGDDDDTIQGDAGNDSILGGLGNDDILGNAGSDTIAGGDGDDEIDGGDDDDTIQGDAGNDSILGGLGNDDILGNAGSDTIAGGDGDDEIDGGDDDDTIQGDAGNDSILGGLGNDDILGNAGSDTIAGGDGDDEIDGGDDDDTIQGDAGNDSILGGLGNDDILGNAGSDTIAGGDGVDDIDGGAEDDTIQGDAGNDTLFGDAGNDSLVGGLDDDSYSGGADIDTFIVTAGADQISDLGLGGLNEILQVSAGASVTATLGAAWTATASSFNAGAGTINTGGFALDLSQITGPNAWTVQGAASADSVVGSTYADVINGNADNDSLGGFNGNDTITGGTGVDNIIGGLGADTFVQNTNDSFFATNGSFANMDLTDGDSLVYAFGVDVVTGFNSLEDELDWSGVTPVQLSTVADLNMDGIVGEGYWAYGNYVGDTFFFNTTGADVLFFEAGDTDLESAAGIGNTSIVLLGASAGWNPANNIV